MPVPTSGDSVRISGTACRCMFDPMSARLASSCSRKGINAVATILFGIGVGLLVSAALSYRLSKQMGLLADEQHRHEAATPIA